MREITVERVTRSWEKLTDRMAERRDIMQRLEPWRHLILDEMISDLWRGQAPDTPQWTLPSVYIAATTDTVVSFLTGKSPVFEVVPVDPTLNADTQAANKIERCMYGFFHEINCYRTTPIQIDVAEMAVHRGYIIGRYLMLSEEEMGLRSEPGEQVYDVETGAVVQSEVVTEYGEFPLEVEIYDPLDCAFSLGRRGQTITFIHKTQMHADQLIEMYPGIEEHEDFEGLDWSDDDSLYTVYDYWDADVNAVVIADKFYKKPTDHRYRGCPVIIELVRPVTIRRAGREYSVREGVAFCSSILESVRGLSWAQSMTASHLDEVGMATMVLTGIDPQPNRSPYWKMGRNGKPVFNMVVNVGPNSRIIPTFGTEHLDYMNPPQLAPIYQEFRSDRLRDIQMTTFAESLLSGAQMVELSGYAYNQIKQAAISRVVPPRLAMDRWFSRCFTGLVECITDEWPYGSSDLFVRLDNGRSLQVTLIELEAVRSVEVKIQPDIPTDIERELQVWFQANQVGAASLERVMSRLPDGGIQDSDLELARISYERMAMTNPQIQMQMAQFYMRRNKITPSGQPTNGAQAMAAPQQPAIGSAAPAQFGPQAASPMVAPGPSPMAGGPAAAGMNPMGGGAVPPEIRQLLAQVAPDLANLPDDQLMNDPRFLQIMEQLMQQQGGM